MTTLHKPQGLPMDVTTIDVCGWRGAIIGMRHPLESWDKSDTAWVPCGAPMIGENDRRLMKRLCSEGTSDRKFLRMIHVQADVIAPAYWWKEYDTYKVATVANSTSTMHKLGSRDLTVDDFCFTNVGGTSAKKLVDATNDVLREWRETKDVDLWRFAIQTQPAGFLYRRMIDVNYETLITIRNDRTGHRLKDEWGAFIDWMTTLPYFDEVYGYTKLKA